MSASCHSNSNFDGASPQYRRILLIVILINAFMFVVEMSYGIVGQSQALKADALDFLGDSATYALSLWAIGRSLETRTNVAMIKGVSLLLMAVWVLVSLGNIDSGLSATIKRNGMAMSLNNNGDEISLFNANHGLVDQFSYLGSQRGVGIQTGH